ncbi:hypothetical protein MTP99_016294 [Tenebrio molitor]|nr:hypothetical protein MTP99_016294 [Tenebrio molitor]
MKMGTEVYHHEEVRTGRHHRGRLRPQPPQIRGGYTGRIDIGMDVAASEFHKHRKCDIDFKNPKSDKIKWITGEKLFSAEEDRLHDRVN